jgi:thiol-disulfide isomerase/thioredoxin
MKHIILKHIIFSLLFLLPTLTISDENGEKHISTPTETLEKFELTTLEGKTLHIRATPNGLDIQEFKGKIIFLSFFGYNCPPCKREIPEFIKIRKKYGKELEIVAVEVRGLNRKYLENYVKDKKINYPVVPFNKATQTFAYHTAKKAEWKGAIPFLIVLDREGEVQFLQTGLIPYDALEIAFQKLK